MREKKKIVVANSLDSGEKISYMVSHQVPRYRIFHNKHPGVGVGVFNRGTNSENKKLLLMKV